MALIFNALNREQQVRVHGAWFTFKPEQIKEMDENKVFFLISKRSHEGFVSLPDELADPEFKRTEEGKRILQEAKAQGVANRVTYLESLKQNELVSLQRDYDTSNIKSDPRSAMSAGMLRNLEELAGYKKAGKAIDAEKIKQIKALESLISEEE
jgi:hypothetical protein